MGEPQFSTEHREQFNQLRKIGELNAINLSLEQLAFGPWVLGSDIGDHDTAERLKSRFRAAVRKAATAAGAPPRANLLDWWISKLARMNRPYLQDLIQRSIELCEEFEAASAEVGWKSRKSEASGGLRRDHYPTDFIMLYWLYDVPHAPLPNPKDEFDFWEDHIWCGLGKLMKDLEKEQALGTDTRKRQPEEPRLAFRNRVAHRVSMGYYRIKPTFECLGFDLAVLLANYVIDRRLTGSDAMRAFDAESAQLIDNMNACWKESSRRLGLSWRKQLREDRGSTDLAMPFRLVKDDLASVVAAPQNSITSSEPGPGVNDSANIVAQPGTGPPVLENSERAHAEPGQKGNRRGRRPNKERREAIREALSKHGDQWRDHLHEIFLELDGAGVSLGDFQGVRISLGDGESQTVYKWEDLDLAEGEERARIIDTLRKYLD